MIDQRQICLHIESLQDGHSQECDACQWLGHSQHINRGRATSDSSRASETSSQMRAHTLPPTPHPPSLQLFSVLSNTNALANVIVPYFASALQVCTRGFFPFIASTR